MQGKIVGVNDMSIPRFNKSRIDESSSPYSYNPIIPPCFSSSHCHYSAPSCFNHCSCHHHCTCHSSCCGHLYKCLGKQTCIVLKNGRTFLFFLVCIRNNVAYGYRWDSCNCDWVDDSFRCSELVTFSCKTCN